MPYRDAADRDAAEEAEIRELRDANDAALHRVRRARLAATSVVLGAVLTGIVVASLGEPRPRTVCHEVQIRYENAPQIPPSTYTACRQL